MELELLGLVGLAAFVIGGGIIMLISSFRRTIELRRALIQATLRIERLEGAMIALTDGRPLPASIVQPALDTAPAAPALEPASPERRQAAQLPPTVAETIAAQAAADHIDPPHIGVLAIFSALAAFAALQAARVGVLIAPAGVALAIVVGLAMLGAAEWRRTAELGKARPMTMLLPSHAALTALLGLSVILAALIYGRWTLGAVSPPLAFVGMAALALGALALSLRYGGWLTAFALAIAAAAPSFATLEQAGPLARYAFLAIFLAATMVLTRRADAPIWAWAAGLIGLIWGAIGIGADGPEPHIFAVAAYAAALGALGLAYAWDAAGEPLPFPNPWSLRWREPIVGGYVLVSAAGAAIAALVLIHAPGVTTLAPAVLALGAATAFASVARPGFWLAPCLAAGFSVALLLLWPAPAQGVIDAPNHVMLSASLALIFALGGGFAMLRTLDARPGATLAAYAPVLIFCAAHTRLSDFAAPGLWAAAAACVAALNIAAYAQFGKLKPGAAAPFAAGAALAAILSLYVLTPPDFAPLALGVALVGLALGARLRGEPGLAIGAMILCALILVRVVTPFLFVGAGTPMEMALMFIPVIITALLAAFLFDPPRAAQSSPPAQAAFALAGLLLVTLASLAARYAFTAGAIGAAYAALGEMGLNTLAWLALACVLAWRFGERPGAFLFVLEFLTFAAALVHAIVVGLALINPWWGVAPAPTPSWGGLSVILFAYGAPAVLFAAYALLRARQGLKARAEIAAVAALALGFATLNLELRRMFNGAAMATAPVSQNEALAYSLAWLGCAAVMFGLAVQRGDKRLSFAALALALAALAKSAMFDLGALDLGARIAATLLLILLGAGLVFGFRRLALPPGATRAKTATSELAGSHATPPG